MPQRLRAHHAARRGPRTLAGSLRRRRGEDAGAIAQDTAAEASHDLPGADRLGSLLHHTASVTTLPGHPDDIADEDWVEDYLLITHVEPGRLWFDEVGPVGVPTAATELAEVGWHVNVVLARLDGTWKLVEVGNVYP